MGPSPESGSEPDVTGHGFAGHDMAKIMDTMNDEAQDDLRFGIFQEIDGGGESLYYQPAPAWKWEGTMPTPEQPWAIVPHAP